MNWMLKATIQNAIAALPEPMSQRLYYAVQRRFGGLRTIDVEDKLRQGVQIAQRARAHGQSIAGARVLEVGTGRRLNLPISLWLQGAERVVTVDLNPYLRAELVAEDLRQIVAEREHVAALFGAELRADRLEALADLSRNFSLRRLLTLCAIEYRAPGDAAALDLPGGTIDLHVSYEVLEHIPGPVLEAILREGRRVAAPGALFVHRIDFSDHFSHSDRNISAINFLELGPRSFRLLAGNRFMYMNRLRLDDFLALYARAGHRVIAVEAEPDPEVVRLLDTGKVVPHTDFVFKSRDTLATLGAWICSRAEGST
ncbi:MAG: methyltransferase domain-containing protein [Polyangiaceae bacterium]|nr:methyltransferase domain-containing protein [Polyangiaceae bacterium]